LHENHTGVAVTITPKGRVHSTVVSTAVLDGKVGFASPRHTVKVKNIQRTGRAAVTVIKLDTRRYVTVLDSSEISGPIELQIGVRPLEPIFLLPF
jgi:hypothetical protein